MSSFIADVLDSVHRYYTLTRVREREIAEIQEKLDALREKHDNVEDITAAEEADTNSKTSLDLWLDREFSRITAQDQQRAEQRLEDEMYRLEAMIAEHREAKKNEIGRTCYWVKKPFKDYLDTLPYALKDVPQADVCRRKIELVDLIQNFHKKLLDDLRWDEYLVLENGSPAYRKVKIRMPKLDKLVKIIEEPLGK